jgi:penicillin amidase
VFSTPLLRAINLSIAVLLMTLLAAAYWYAWRPLPETSGEIAAPISGQATIPRDALGVPHISAASWEDAIFLQGYVTAQDRLWQMDALRRLAAGELAEVVGRQSLESDQESRRLRLARIAEQSQRTMPPGDQAVLAAYARGVNYYLETHRGRLPLEFSLLNYDPRPWSARDSLLAGLEMYRILTSSWREELTRLHLLERGDRAKAEFLFPVRAGTEPQPGSNAWVVSGAHSATGKPILANDPHLDFSMPATWYLIHLRAPGLNVTGASLPGIPGVIVGHNERIAWGVTNLQFDVQDLYRERLDPQSGRYVFREKSEQARLEKDIIAVKGARPVETDAWITRHGPVFVTDQGQAYALRWVAAEAGSLQFPILDLDRARSWPEFRAALARYQWAGQNFVYADVDGNIGYQVAGRLPIRKGSSEAAAHNAAGRDQIASPGSAPRAVRCGGDVPADGTAGECEWEGYIPFDHLPQAFNPPSGILATANQNPFSEDYRYPVSGNFAPPYRVSQIRALLESRAQWRPEEMLNVQKDVYSAFADFLARQVVAAWDAHRAANPQLSDAVELLRRWNGQMEKGTAAPLVAALVFEQLRKAVAERAAPTGGQTYESAMAPAVLERLLRERPIAWFSDYDRLLMKCLSEAIDEGGKIQGSKVPRWDYGYYNELRIVHPIAGRLPLIGKYFNIGPVPMSGSSTTVKQTTRRLGPSMRMIVDLSDLDRSLQNLTIGESGQWLSRHYKDQWNAYYSARSFPMQFRNVEAKQTLVVNPRSF